MDSLYDDIFSAQSNTANNKRNYEPEEEDQTKFKNIQYFLFPFPSITPSHFVDPSTMRKMMKMNSTK